MNAFPHVSVVIPCFNERGMIAGCLDSILASDYPDDHLEILVADGMSNDGTRSILEDYARHHKNIRLIDNPEKAVPYGLNRAIRMARGELIIRIDAHAEYAPDYIQQCVTLLQETGADNVGGAQRAKGSGLIQQAISLAHHSPFAVGGARFHNVDYEGYVDTVPYGCWKKERLIEFGLFDEELVRNQDDELNLRIIRQGGKIWQSTRIRSWYYPRTSLLALFRQYQQYGYWKVRVIQKHKLPASWRHLIPGSWLAILVCLAAFAFFTPEARWLLSGYLSLYALGCLAAALLICKQQRQYKFIPVLPPVFAIYHIAYGYGFLRGILDFAVLRRGARESFKTVTRSSVQDGER
ncbi:MAG: glycosyltransferase family 2 protein [Acidobacteria bacterium]|nr:MAG: glycosyltransferase family 2 protein [Acidobacteriota bacterium]